MAVLATLICAVFTWGPRDRSADLRPLAGVAKVDAYRTGPGLAPPKPASFDYTVTLQPDPDAAVFAGVLGAARRWQGLDAPAGVWIEWTEQGRTRQLRMYDDSPEVSAEQLAGLPAEPEDIAVRALTLRGSPSVTVQARCVPERFVEGCIRAFRATTLPVSATEIEFAGNLSNANHTVDFGPGEADRIAQLYAGVRAAAGTAQYVGLTALRDPASSAPTSTQQGTPRDWLILQWSTGGAVPGRSEPTTELDAVARFLAGWRTPAHVVATVDGRPGVDWHLDRCLEFSTGRPLNPRVYAAAHAAGRPALEPAGCPSP